MWTTILMVFLAGAAALAASKLVAWVYEGDDWAHMAAQYGSFAATLAIGGAIIANL